MLMCHVMQQERAKCKTHLGALAGRLLQVGVGKHGRLGRPRAVGSAGDHVVGVNVHGGGGGRQVRHSLFFYCISHRTVLSSLCACLFARVGPIPSLTSHIPGPSAPLITRSQLNFSLCTFTEINGNPVGCDCYYAMGDGTRPWLASMVVAASRDCREGGTVSKAALVDAALDEEVTIDTPRGAPRVPDDEVILALCAAIANRNNRVVH